MTTKTLIRLLESGPVTVEAEARGFVRVAEEGRIFLTEAYKAVRMDNTGRVFLSVPYEGIFYEESYSETSRITLPLRGESGVTPALGSAAQVSASLGSAASWGSTLRGRASVAVEPKEDR